MTYKILILAAGLSLSACQQPAESQSSESAVNSQNTEDQRGEYADISSDEAKTMIDADRVVVLDVRTPGEYEEGHIADAELININDSEFEEKLSKLPKGEAYLVYCHSGNRSSRAMEKMQKMGFKKVYNLEGGITGWKEANFETK